MSGMVESVEAMVVMVLVLPFGFADMYTLGWSRWGMVMLRRVEVGLRMSGVDFGTRHDVSHVEGED